VTPRDWPHIHPHGLRCVLRGCVHKVVSKGGPGRGRNRFGLRSGRARDGSALSANDCGMAMGLPPPGAMRRAFLGVGCLG
jgi:hypothetical protein